MSRAATGGRLRRGRGWIGYSFIVIEVCVLLAAFVTLTALVAGVRIEESYHRQGDNLLYEQVIDSIWQGRGARSSIFNSTQRLIDSDVLTKGKDDYAAIVDAFDPNDDRNLLKFHAYLITYPLALFRAVASAPTVVAVVDALCFTGMVLLAYCWLRRSGVGIAGTLAFVVLMMMHPAWGVSIFGQFYPDRLFLPFGLLFYIAIVDRWRLLWVVLIGLVTLSINERAFTILGLFLLGYAVFFFDRAVPRRSAFCAGAGLALLVIGSIIQNHVLENVYYGGFMPTTIAEVKIRFARPDFRDKVAIFMLINAGLVGLAVFRGRAVPIVVGLMLPNILGSIGGAEKTGFSTHYHTYYFPSLVWGAALGYANLTRSLSEGFALRRWPSALVPLAVALLCVPVLLSHLVDWTETRRPRLSWNTAVTTNLMFRFPGQLREAFGAEGAQLRLVRDEAIAAIPAGSRISAPENAMWPIPPGNSISLYPFALNTATHLVVVCELQPDGSLTWNAVTSFLPPAQQRPIEDFFKARARALGFDVDHPHCGQAPFRVGVIPRSPKSE